MNIKYENTGNKKTVKLNEPLISIDNLEVKFINQDATIHAVNGVDIKLDKGKVLTILGESGSGKSVTMRSILRLLPPKASLSGSIIVDGKNIIDMSQDQLSNMRGREVSMIFQEPMVAFDPVYKVGAQIAETVVRHLGTSFNEGLARAKELFDLVQIPSAKSRLSAYPHELSGGMRQRAMIALALACSPKLLLADEPTTALDATVQIQILLLLRELQRELGMSIIFVTHDVGVATEIADDLAVMYAGKRPDKTLGGETFVFREEHLLALSLGGLVRLPWIYDGARVRVSKSRERGYWVSLRRRRDAGDEFYVRFVGVFGTVGERRV